MAGDGGRRSPNIMPTTPRTPRTASGRLATRRTRSDGRDVDEEIENHARHGERGQHARGRCVFARHCERDRRRRDNQDGTEAEGRHQPERQGQPAGPGRRRRRFRRCCGGFPAQTPAPCQLPRGMPAASACAMARRQSSVRTTAKPLNNAAAAVNISPANSDRD